MKKSVFLSVAILATMMVASCGGNTKKTQSQNNAPSETPKTVEVSPETLDNLPAEPVFEVETSLGTMQIKLYEGTPLHRENFAKLALSGFYNGLLFHRVINGFMVQGGDPLSSNEAEKEKWGTGGPGYTVPAEIFPQYRHKKGALAAARRGDAANPTRSSSGSQFYIVQDETACSSLDGQYTVFGETIKGLEVIDKIASVATDGRDRPVEPVKIISIKLAE